MLPELAIFGNKPRHLKGQPQYNTIGVAEKHAVSEVLAGGELSGFVASASENFWGGKNVRALEDQFKARYNCAYALSFNSATSALHAALWAVCLNPGDEVIVPPYTMSASATTALMVGAVPIFADIEDKYFCLNHENLDALVTERTRAVVVVNLFGHTAKLQEIKTYCDSKSLIMIEDNSQSPDAMSCGLYAGTVGHVGVFSFNRHKTIQAGEGGVAITKNADLSDRMAFLRNHGEAVAETFGFSSVANTGGLNLRMTEMEAAVALVQLDRLVDLNQQRIELAEYLSERIENVPGLSRPKIRDNCTHVYYVYAMKFDVSVVGIPRDMFVKCLAAEGYRVRAGYVEPLYRNQIYQKRIFMGSKGFPFSENSRNYDDCYSPDGFPVCERVQNSELIIGDIVYPPLTSADIDHFIEDCCKIVDQADKVMSHLKNHA